MGNLLKKLMLVPDVGHWSECHIGHQKVTGSVRVTFAHHQSLHCLFTTSHLSLLSIKVHVGKSLERPNGYQMFTDTGVHTNNLRPLSKFM